MTPTLSFKPLTPARWEDFTILFGERGACGGCWCMLWRLPRRQFDEQKGKGNKQAMKAIVDAGEIPGILAYDGRRPVGWCAIAPRERYSYLARSRILKPVDDRPCWSVSCLFIDKGYRRKQVSSELLKSAVAFAESQGAQVVEGYPVEPTPGKVMAPVFAWTGLASAFRRAGFQEVARRSPTRPIMRIERNR
jgi:GNAT superfamily N-acetyltransferase